MFSRLDTTTACDLHTDRQTDIEILTQMHSLTCSKISYLYKNKMENFWRTSISHCRYLEPLQLQMDNNNINPYTPPFYPYTIKHLKLSYVSRKHSNS